MINIVMRKILKYFDTIDIFTSKKISTSEENDEYIDPVTGYNVIGDPEVLWDDICFIENTKEIWTHGEYWQTEKREITIANSVSSQELLPNTLYKFTERTNNLSLTLSTPVSYIANEYHMFITIGSTVPTITWPTGLSWNGGDPPTITANTTYEISILNNIAIYIEV